jgi:hypothetical protein
MLKITAKVAEFGDEPFEVTLDNGVLGGDIGGVELLRSAATLAQGEPVNTVAVQADVPKDHAVDPLSVIALAEEEFDEILKVESDEELVTPTEDGTVN